MALQPELSGLGQGEILQVVHQPVEEHRLFVKRGNDTLIRLHHAILNRLQVAPDVGKWSAQLVGHVGRHIAAQLFEPGQPVGHTVKGA